jgi:cell wall-associated NlpC family hydrolase
MVRNWSENFPSSERIHDVVQSNNIGNGREYSPRATQISPSEKNTRSDDIGSAINTLLKAFNDWSFWPSSTNNVMGGNSAIVDSAKTFMGTKYVWGGQGKEGIDCSGLVVESMKLAGKPIPDMTAAQMLAQTDPISPAEAQPGDLVLAKNGKHVEIFTGMQWSQFGTIGSASSRKGVSVGTLSPGEYVIHRNNLSEKSSGDFPQNNVSNGQIA